LICEALQSHLAAWEAFSDEAPSYTFYTSIGADNVGKDLESLKKGFTQIEIAECMARHGETLDRFQRHHGSSEGSHRAFATFESRGDRPLSIATVEDGSHLHVSTGAIATGVYLFGDIGARPEARIALAGLGPRAQAIIGQGGAGRITA
jgi:hypothetical protein